MTDTRDFRGSRRLVGGEEWFWYLLAGASYVLAGVWHKWVLNWLLGPLWLVTVIVVGPWLVDRARSAIGLRRSVSDRHPDRHTGDHTDDTQ
jgi:hypothetical protein